MRIRPAASARVPSSLLALLALLCACSGAAPVQLEPPSRASVDLTYLLDPLAGYPLPLAGGPAEVVSAAYANLSHGEPVTSVQQQAEELAAAHPGFHPSVFLLAATAFLEADHFRVIELLTPVAAELPEYDACNLLLGRSLESVDQLPRAYEAYLRSASLRAAERRLQELRPRVVEISAYRFQDRLRRGRLEEAEKEVLRLERWAPEEVVALESRWAYSAAIGDPEAERATLSALLRQEPERRDLLERLADLETERENVEASLQILQGLVATYPEDEGLRQKKERVTFLWRLRRFPAQVQEVTRKEKLVRADMAILLYWLVPEVRFARVSNPPIASDILGHPRRDEILRVIQLGLLPVDERMHRFEPERTLSRRRALSALVRVLGLAGQSVTCADRTASRSSLSTTLVCEVAAGCGLIPETADCLPTAPLSGLQALDLFRRTLNLLGSR